MARFEHGWPAFHRLSAISKERACFYHFRGYRERQVGGTLSRRLAADLPQGADLHMARTDRARNVLTMAASPLHRCISHGDRTPVMRTV